MSNKVTSKQQVETIINKYDNFLFDCDGVLWLSNHLLPYVIETLNLLRSHNKKLIFVTNNSTKSRNEYVKKFESFGLTVSKDEIFSSAYATAIYVSNILKLPKDKKVWVLGQNGIEEELKEIGYETLGGTSIKLSEALDISDSNSPVFNLDPSVGAVVVGLDFNVNYLKLSVTLQYLLKGLPFVATNIDSTFPSKSTKLPGAGSIVEMVAFAYGKQPDVSCGKPSKGMMDAIIAGHHLDKSRSIMIGDRLNTDMKFGRDNGLDTLLVLSGIETEERVLNLQKDETITWYANKLGDLWELNNK